MKLTNNTLIPKIITMNTEISIIDRTITEVISVLTMEDELKFVTMIKTLIERMPKLKYFDEEIESIKECLVDVYAGNENRESTLQYIYFMKSVVHSTQNYISEMK